MQQLTNKQINIKKNRYTMEVEIWWAMVIGMVPLIGWLLWWWNDIWFVLIRSSKGHTNLPPGHMGLPVMGETLKFLWYFKFLRQPDDYINSKRHKYGNEIGMYRTHLFGKPSVIVMSPSIIKFVLRDNESFRLVWPNIDLVGKDSMAVAQGKVHSRLRSIVLRNISHPDALRKFALSVQPQMISTLQSWAERRTVNSFQELIKLIFEIFCMHYASFEPGLTVDKLDRYLSGLIMGFRSYPLNIPGSTLYNALKCRAKAIAIFREEMEKRKKNNDEGRSRPTKDIMDGLMNMKDEDGSQLSDVEVLDNLVSILLAGHQSTSLATMWSIYYLAKYPKVLQKLREENMSLKKSKSQQHVTSDEILKLKYTMKVVNETIRLANVAGFLFRRSTKDIHYKGYTIPKGWTFLLWLRYVHLDAENFNDPMNFNPDRWDDSTITTNFQAFGDGPKTCVGYVNARLQQALFLHHLSTGYKWELVNPNAKVKYLPYPKPEDGVQITIEKL